MRSNTLHRPRPTLSLIDAASIMVGIIIGSAIFEIAPQAASGAAGYALRTAGLVSSSGTGSVDQEQAALCIAAIVSIWLLGAFIALIGAMCYAELATAFPEVGGTYVYLSEALGRTVGFAFAWAEFWIVRPGNVGAVAYVMARYARQLAPQVWQAGSETSVIFAAGAIIVLAVLNAIGLRVGTRAQNILTAAKIVGLLSIVAIGLTSSAPAQPLSAKTLLEGSLTLALIQIMFAYGGWADISFVAAEVREPSRNIFRALVLGTATVAAIYVLVNLAFVRALGVGGVMQSQAVGVDVVSLRLGDSGSRAISILVVVSCLGAINGMLLTGSRVFYALGTHHPTFYWLGAWNAATGVPLRSLVLQVLVTVGLVIACRGGEGFGRLVVFTAPFYWGFIALVGVALLVLRASGRTRGAAYHVPLFPLTPLVFAATSGAMVYAGVNYALSKPATEAWWAAIVVASGVIVGVIDWRFRAAKRIRSGRHGQGS